MRKSEDRIRKYLRSYLEVAPISLAIWRSVEAKQLSRVELRKPVLDIGCGFGEFAGVFFESHVEMGVDIDYEALVRAMKAGKYLSLARSDARKLPFGDNSFYSVISVSTLEHIIGPDKTIKEAFRVLKPGGKLVLTVVTNKFNKYTFYGPLFVKMGLRGIGKNYNRILNRVFKHHVIIGREKWEKYIRNAGFKIEESREIISPRVTRLFDLFLISALPSQMVKLVFGKRFVVRPKFLLNLLTSLFIKVVEKDETEGSNLFIVARKL